LVGKTGLGRGNAQADPRRLQQVQRDVDPAADQVLVQGKAGLAMDQAADVGRVEVEGPADVAVAQGLPAMLPDIGQDRVGPLDEAVVGLRRAGQPAGQVDQQLLQQGVRFLGEIQALFGPFPIHGDQAAFGRLHPFQNQGLVQRVEIGKTDRIDQALRIEHGHRIRSDRPFQVPEAVRVVEVDAIQVQVLTGFWHIAVDQTRRPDQQGARLKRPGPAADGHLAESRRDINQTVVVSADIDEPHRVR